METEQQLATLGNDLEAMIERQNESLESGLIAETVASAEQAKSASAWLIIIVSAVVLMVLVVDAGLPHPGRSASRCRRAALARGRW